MTSPLERRYRAVLGLLPEPYRRRREAEMLGLLLDLDEGRAYPSLRQSAGLVLLALRLRLPARGAALTVLLPVLLSMSLVMLGTLVVSPEAVEYRDPVHGVISAVPLAALLAWLFDKAWVAWVLAGTELGWVAVVTVQHVLHGDFGSLNQLLYVLPVLGLFLATMKGVRAPRPRWLWLAAIAAGLTVRMVWFVTVGLPLQTWLPVAVLATLAIGATLRRARD